jgi:predicted nucleic acid-binding protein
VARRTEGARAPEEAIVITLDTGALIAFERRNARITGALRSAQQEYADIVVPAVVLAEWWRGPPRELMRRFLAAVTIAPADERVARAAGEAMAAIPRATTVDALVMATAALRGGVVYTSDVDDLERLREHFRAVRVLSV